MRHLLFLLLCLSMLLPSCAGTKPQPTDERAALALVRPPAAPALDTAVRLRLDSLTVLTPRTWLQKVAAGVGHPPRPATVIGKKSTINYFYSPATVISAGKKATVAAGPGATALVKPKGQTQVGDGNTATAPVAPAASTLTFFGRIKRWLTNAGEVVLLGLLLLLLLAIIFRKRLGFTAGFPF